MPKMGIYFKKNFTPKTLLLAQKQAFYKKLNKFSENTDLLLY